MDFLRGTANSGNAGKTTGDRAPEPAPAEVEQKWWSRGPATPVASNPLW